MSSLEFQPDDVAVYSEREQIVAGFVSRFKDLAHFPIALYGVGRNTYYILQGARNFNILGLMDQENTGREVFGLPVLSNEQAAQSVKYIIIVARPAVIPIIYGRIDSLAREHGIGIYDLGGNKLSAPSAALPSRPAGGCRNGESRLRQAISEADVVSFDIFDTLLMRKVLRPEHVFDLVEQSLPARLGFAAPFRLNRILAEQIAAEKRASPTIDLIYEELARLLGLPERQKRMLLEEEIAAELRVLMPRRKMAAIFRETVAQGKTVYLISDMYFSKEVLSRMLAANGIAGHKDLLVSSGLGMTKRSGDLFRHFRRLEPAAVHLHIGDDPFADIEAPRRLGTRAFQVESAYEMLLHSPFARLLANVSTRSDALALGLFVSRAFNNPFALHEFAGRLQVNNEFDLGYLAYGAILTGFIGWVWEKTGGHSSAKILFGARDGYLVHKLYLRFLERFGIEDAPEGIYFLTSRRAATVPHLQDRRDILTLLQTVPGSPSYGEILEIYFGVTANPSDQRRGKRFDRENFEDLAAFIIESEQRILENARAERDAYREYARSLGAGPGTDLYFFDLITSGTIPHFLKHVLGKEPTCLCFIVNLPVKYAFAAEPFCYLGKMTPYQRSRKFFATHYLTESILTAPFPEFTRMSGDGVPIYGHPEDSHKHFDKVRLTQDGIEAYFAEFLGLAAEAAFEPISIALADEMNGILCSENCFLNEELKASHIVNDRYTFSQPLNPWTTMTAFE